MALKKIDASLLRELESSFESGGTNLGAAVSTSEEVVLFGSRAVGCAGVDSDWDILFVSECNINVPDQVQAVVVTPSLLLDARWSTGELATHVCRYGQWIKGDGSWASDSPEAHAAILKRRQIALEAIGLMTHLNDLDPLFVRSHSVSVKMNVIRLILLERKSPVPPTPCLRVWCKIDEGLVLRVQRRLAQVLERQGVSLDEANRFAFRVAEVDVFS